MPFSRLSFLLCLILFSFGSVAAQEISPVRKPKTDKEEKQKKLEKQVLEMLDAAVGEATTLKLPNNRAIVYAVAGDLYWKFDEKRARELFRSAGNEMAIANAEAEKDKSNADGLAPTDFDNNDPRFQLLPLIARHDADLALEILVQTRSAATSEALAKAAQPNASLNGDYPPFSPNQRRAQQEITLEQHFAMLAVEQNPDQAIKLIKNSLTRGISYDVIPMLQKLHQKDEKKAASLSDDVIGKILDTDLARKSDDLKVAVNFLRFSIAGSTLKNSKEKPFKFTDAQVKKLADKLVNTFLQSSNSLEITRVFSRVMKDLEKLVPEKAALLQQKRAEKTKNLPTEVRLSQERDKLWNIDSTPEDVLVALPKLGEEEKKSAYQSLIFKIANLEDEARAKSLIEQIPDENIRRNALEMFESGRISRKVRTGNLEEALNLIGNLSRKKLKIQQYVGLALEFQKRTTEKDRETAADLMRNAKSLANEFPEDEDELADLMEIVRGYATIDPDESFRLFAPVVDQINDFIQASAILSKYNKRSRTFKKGELIMKVNGYSGDGVLLFRFIPQIQLLGKADLEKMNSYADRFQRADARTIVKLFVAQGFLAKQNNARNVPVGVSVY